MKIRKSSHAVAVAAAIVLTSPAIGEGSRPSDDLLLSDEIVPFEELGEGTVERPKLVGEAIEHGFFASNRERERKIRKRNEMGMEIEVGERRSFFGNDPFLGPGTIDGGIELPTGAVVQPQLSIYGEVRTAIQSFDNRVVDVTEWANRLDLFANLFLTPTERILLGFRPLDREGEFTGYRFRGNQGEGSVDQFNGNVHTLFFEGDLGEMFPKLDLEDGRSLDYGIAFGRMPLSFQDGILINDSIDAVGITRTSLFWFGASAFRITGLVGLNEIHRADNIEDDDAMLYGIFMAADYEKATYEVDVAYVNGGGFTSGDGLYAGVGQTRRFGHLNSTMRANFSWALDEESAAVSTGTLLFSELSRTMPYNRDIVYVNGFWAIDEYASAARGPATGGPLGRTGLLFEAVGLGEYGSALRNGASNAAGGALGYQHFLDEKNRRQLVGEIGGRVATDEAGPSAGAIGARYQQAIGQHLILALDGFGALYEGGEWGYGARCEVKAKF